MIHLIRHESQWVVSIDGEATRYPTIEIAAERIESTTQVQPDTIDQALISMYTHGFNAAEFDEAGNLTHVGEADVQIL